MIATLSTGVNLCAPYPSPPTSDDGCACSLCKLCRSGERCRITMLNGQDFQGRVTATHQDGWTRLVRSADADSPTVYLVDVREELIASIEVQRRRQP